MTLKHITPDLLRSAADHLHADAGLDGPPYDAHAQSIRFMFLEFLALSLES